ncbi:hypothetical protein JTB14_021341 [Gonioctena quinquepunctata]|nr:hypothetical protein JTB14_021341 [Gonioctena quinquepunctata]
MSDFGFPFRFPADAHEKAVWLEKLGLKEFTETVSKYARICSIHFEGEAFEIKPSGKIFLRKGARPLFFNEEYIPTTETASTSRLDNRKSSTDSTDTAPGTNFSILSILLAPLKRAVIDLSTSDFSTPRKARRNFGSMKKTVQGQIAKIKTLQQSVRRLRSKVTNLNPLINHLKSKSLVHEDCETSLRAALKVFCGIASDFFARIDSGLGEFVKFKSLSIDAVIPLIAII